MSITISHRPTKQLLAEVAKKLRSIDCGEKVSAIHVINFEDAHDLIKILSLDVYSIIEHLREKPCSYQELAKLTKKDRSTIVRIVNTLAEIGLAKISDEINEGHGRRKLIQSAWRGQLILQARI
jgi:predicted transcriptional regulator